mmetsp:Transcript_1837/g.2183  ORF Transcript_1837/g.2183 Transcript_1837/m.2183 type:complete len:203 (-) Transcript_1837:761-1369(-)
MNGDDHDLSWTYPERPLTTPVLTKHSKHTLHTSQHRAMHNHRTFKLLALLLGPRIVLQVKTNGKLEIQLNRRTLMNTLHRIHDLNVNLRAIESSILRVHLPCTCSGKLIHRVRQRLLRAIPKLDITQCLLRSRRKLQLVCHSKRSVHLLHKLQSCQHLFLDLILATEDMSVILLESTDTCKTRQCTTQLIPMQHTEVGIPER